jgi:hypothetical protein
MTLVPAVQYPHPERLTPREITEDDLTLVPVYLRELNEHYRRQFTQANTRKEMLIRYFTGKDAGLYNAVKNACYNESVADHVRKVFEKHKMVEYRNELIQQILSRKLDRIQVALFRSPQVFHGQVSRYLPV